MIKNVGLSIILWLRCPLDIWAFALDGNLVKNLLNYIIRDHCLYTMA